MVSDIGCTSKGPGAAAGQAGCSAGVCAHRMMPLFLPKQAGVGFWLMVLSAEVLVVLVVIARAGWLASGCRRVKRIQRARGAACL